MCGSLVVARVWRVEGRSQWALHAGEDAIDRRPLRRLKKNDLLACQHANITTLRDPEGPPLKSLGSRSRSRMGRTGWTGVRGLWLAGTRPHSQRVVRGSVRKLAPAKKTRKREERAARPRARGLERGAEEKKDQRATRSMCTLTRTWLVWGQGRPCACLERRAGAVSINIGSI